MDYLVNAVDRTGISRVGEDVNESHELLPIIEDFSEGDALRGRRESALIWQER
jgi:hypothetical protein